MDLLEDDQGKKEKITRDAFLYMSPKEPKDEFAQCMSCEAYMPGTKRCAILEKTTEVLPDMSCGLYVHGEPSDEQEQVGSVTAEEAGLVHRQVRCQNCSWFGPKGCELFNTLNEAHPDIFDLDTDVDENACCNAQTPKA